tara:strand:- start:435 stop:761 length:327 start_codon:yes stop_codon:yes gene_type:complete
MTEAATRQRANVIDTNAEVLLREVELRGRLAELQQNKTPQELAAEKLPMVSVAAVTFLTALFYGACMWLDESVIAVLAAVTSTLISSFIGLLKSCLAPTKNKPDTSGD